MDEREESLKKKQREMEECLVGEEKKRMKVEKKMVGVGRVEYCSSLRIGMREKFGLKVRSGSG